MPDIDGMKIREHPRQLWKGEKSFLKQYVRETLVLAQDDVLWYSRHLTMFLLAAFLAHQNCNRGESNQSKIKNYSCSFQNCLIKLCFLECTQDRDD